MSRSKLFILGYLALIIISGIQACAKFDTLPQLEIQVVDETGAYVSGAFVSLFDTADEWSKRKNPLQVWRKTDSEGKVLFTDLHEIEYFVYVRFDGKDNSLDEISTMAPLTINKRKIITIHIR